jgi:hypothetical protein
MGLLSAPRADRFAPVKGTRYPFYKRLGGLRSFSGRVWKVHHNQQSNPGPNESLHALHYRVPLFIKAKRIVMVPTQFSVLLKLSAPKNINFNTELTFIFLFYFFYSLTLSSYNCDPCLLHINIFTNVVFFFWVIPRCLNFMCRRFGTFCLCHLLRSTCEDGRDWVFRNLWT